MPLATPLGVQYSVEVRTKTGFLEIRGLKIITDPDGNPVWICTPKAKHKGKPIVRGTTCLHDSILGEAFA